MQVFKTLSELNVVLSEFRLAHKTIGFVPTMGALHNGHISLINYSKQQCDVTICSIFVNPTQFNNAEDLEHYPKTPETDCNLLEIAGCDFLYMPSVEDVYPTNDRRIFNFGYLDTILEAAHRPGHFNGVGQVVSILLEGIKPSKAFFGKKDYQQVMVVKELVKQLQLPIEIISCPILREDDGLAMSSRNVRLSNQERIVAALIPKIMKEAEYIAKYKSVADAKLFVNDIISKISIMKLEYYEICDSETLQILNSVHSELPTVALIAVFVGKIRLIDNL